MNKIVICFVIAAMFLLPTVNCVSVSVQTNVGAFTEHLGSGVGGQINGNTVITRDALSHAVWANGPVTSGNNNRGCSYASTKSVSDNAGDTASTSVSISNAKSYSYRYGLSNMGSFAAAAEALDVTGANSINAQAKAYNTKVAAPDVSVSTTVTNGDLHGYNNMAIAAANLGYAFQSFDSATGTKVQCDSVARGLSSKWSSAQENAAPEASISTSTTTAGTTITNYEDSVTKSSLGTSIEQNAGIVGTFTSKSTAKTASITRTSDYGTKYDIDMQANIANSLPSVQGTLTYYINPNLNVQKAIETSKVGDTITLAAGKYDQTANIGKSVTVRGQGVTGTITNTGGISKTAGNNYVNSKEVFLRADDVFWYTDGWEWMTGLVNGLGIKATYAVVPNEAQLDLTGIQILNSLNKNNIELATHGLTHDEHLASMSYTDQYNDISTATNLMTNLYYKPRTFVSPYGEANADTLKALTALGYHTISAASSTYQSGATINQIDVGFDFENNDWGSDNQPSHKTASDFEQAFTNSNAQNYLITVHPTSYYWLNPDWSYSDTTQLATDRAQFANAMTWLKGQNVEFLTMDQAYRYGQTI